jgi:hypothetical protein
MEQDTEETIVIFRKYKKRHTVYKSTPEILALFPEIIGDPNKLTCMCYQHVGQHGDADYGYCINELTVPAKPEEYSDLKEELESLGYKLKVMRKWMRRPGRRCNHD